MPLTPLDNNYSLDHTFIISRSFSCPFMVGYFPFKAQKSGVILPDATFSKILGISLYLRI